MPHLFLAAALAAAMAAGPAALDRAEEAAAVAGAPAVDPIVWTNDHIEQRYGPRPAEPAAPAATEPEPQRYVRALDPEWYRERIAPLEEELAAVEERAARIRQFLAAPLDYAQPGLVIRQRPMRLSPENELALLAGRRADLAARIHAIQDEARRQWLPPGAVR